ncbi:methyltransferase domain-containing protein [Collinsella sp. AGMB00827]|uniref:Methyltransferase domain-containing protein n=1 Tax=Collinsella ureilytica TaxID=2869515 RepID=A0ABS7MK10_9ACTN|nr:class I SAM-dependent methyltransferase [Collinsella urealyticum]MBY4797602.1 methyltransferase domain-containing protein [Collinsella urealyticum]
MDDLEEFKEKFTAYWNGRAEGFYDLRRKELASDMHLRWLQEIESRLPQGEALSILDIGCGPGLFSCMLAGRGHTVLGIDIADEMIAEAHRLSKELNVDATFAVMDAEQPTLEPGSFDAIVTRNLTWGLPHLDQAYATWRRLLKPGGALICFDADYVHEQVSLPDVPGSADSVISDDQREAYQEFKDTLRPIQRKRPAWDVELLQKACYSDIEVDEGLWKRIYLERDELYNPSPMFAVVARA